LPAVAVHATIRAADDSALATGYTMQAPPNGPGFDRIVQKWHDLAQRRLDHYTELYRSGRWQHYYSQERFALRMLEVIEVAKRWRGLAGMPQLDRPEQSPQGDDTLRPAA
jgi:hypothetical protein